MSFIRLQMMTFNNIICDSFGFDSFLLVQR